MYILFVIQSTKYHILEMTVYKSVFQIRQIPKNKDISECKKCKNLVNIIKQIIKGVVWNDDFWNDIIIQLHIFTISNGNDS